MTQRDLGEYSRDESRAQRLVDAIRTFVDEFRTRQEVGQLRKLLAENKLSGGILEQAPEDFTEHEFVEPCLDALGYSDPQRPDISVGDVQFRRQPSRYPKIEQKRPDYELRNVHDRLTCIVEVKAINREPLESPGPATENIDTYLFDNTFCKYARNHPPGVLAGIGTDGFTWVLWLKDLDTGAVYDDVVRRSIVDPISSIAACDIPEWTDETEALDTRVAARKQLESRLVRPFSREHLLAEVTDTIDRIDSLDQSG